MLIYRIQICFLISDKVSITLRFLADLSDTTFSFVTEKWTEWLLISLPRAHDIFDVGRYDRRTCVLQKILFLGHRTKSWGRGSIIYMYQQMFSCRVSHTSEFGWKDSATLKLGLQLREIMSRHFFHYPVVYIGFGMTVVQSVTVEVEVLRACLKNSSIISAF